MKGGCVCGVGGGRREERAHLGRALDGERGEGPLTASSSHHLWGRQVGHEGAWLAGQRGGLEGAGRRGGSGPGARVMCWQRGRGWGWGRRAKQCSRPTSQYGRSLERKQKAPLHSLTLSAPSSKSAWRSVSLLKLGGRFGCLCGSYW